MRRALRSLLSTPMLSSSIVAGLTVFFGLFGYVVALDQNPHAPDPIRHTNQGVLAGALVGLVVAAVSHVILLVDLVVRERRADAGRRASSRGHSRS